ncbi:MAG TPA: type IV secretion protein Rhs, partial [Micromonosporaceae bacterium]|nr:type IV secretion protein Rhs [Micromonosporaceae bacterium]
MRFVVRNSGRRWKAAAVCVVLAATLIGAVSRSTAAEATPGPSVDLPPTPSVPTTPQEMQPRPPDQASSRALRGDQPASGAAREGAGTPEATPLSASATWSVSPHTGDFHWSYPLRVPPVPGALTPPLALSYTSSAVDGRTSSTNNQPTWIGDGWDLHPGFVERTYGPCALDKEGSASPQTGDLCWRSDNATAAYNGAGGMLIREAGSQDLWRAKDDDGARIWRDTGAGNDDDNGEYWKVTTTDGTQYFFGSRPDARSTWTVPVFGDDTGEPCHGTTFDASSCRQAWRWNLDKVVDAHGNTILYYYDTEPNAYGFNHKEAAVSYVRGGTLRRIEYGLRPGVTTPAARVEFAVADRCVPGSTCTFDRKDNWPDTPLAERCDTATCRDRWSPTFWSTKRLASVTTQVRRGGGYSDVDRWVLDQQFPDPGDGEKAALWLKSVTHTGLIGGSITQPPVTFEGHQMPNRVYQGDGLSPLIRYRITGIISESGGVTSVSYAQPDCVPGSSMPANPQSNTLRCFPVRWARPDHAERTDYFH